MSMGIGVNLSDPRTAAAAARFHQLLQNGVPKEQASQIMQQEGGMIPIANLAIAYQQLQDAAKRSQVQPPSPGTVAQHIFAADAQMHGQMPPQQMPPQMPPQQMPPQQMPPQQPDPRMAGVANLPNTMGATGYGGGGIVAFSGKDNEQQVQGDVDWTEEDEANLNKFKNLDRAANPIRGDVSFTGMGSNPSGVLSPRADLSLRTAFEKIAPAYQALQAKHDLYAQQSQARHEKNVAAETAARYGIVIPHAVTPAGITSVAPGATPAALGAAPTGTPIDISKILGGGDDSGYGKVSVRGGMGLGSIPKATAHTTALDKMIAEDAPETPKDVGDELAQIMKFNEQNGIGSASKQYSDYLNKRQQDLGEEYKKDRRMAIANAGFAMAQAASQPGQAGNGLSKFLASASVGGAQAAQGIMAIHQQQRKSEQALAEDRLKLAQSDELRKAGYARDATILAREGMRDYVQNRHYYENLGAEKDKLESEAERTNATIQGQLLHAQITSEAARGRVPYEQVLRDKAARLGEYIASNPKDPHIDQLKEYQTNLHNQLTSYYENATPKGFGYGQTAEDKIGPEVDRYISSTNGMMVYNSRIEALKKAGMDEMSAGIQARHELINQFLAQRGISSGASSAAAPTTGWGSASVVSGGT